MKQPGYCNLAELIVIINDQYLKSITTFFQSYSGDWITYDVRLQRSRAKISWSVPWIDVETHYLIPRSLSTYRLMTLLSRLNFTQTLELFGSLSQFCQVGRPQDQSLQHNHTILKKNIKKKHIYQKHTLVNNSA